ncbi:MAG: DNA methyltransferase [Candidatus Dormibacteraeota bacterium]|nr:DNA methyltransferase [Candidatus Dormibacteraeota bacterium]
MTSSTNDSRLIESDAFAFEFLSQVGERESWRKEIHRPVYHLHKWWAQRLGSVFRGILLGASLGESGDLSDAFYTNHDFGGMTVLDPFMGSGTTIGEAHKLGFTTLGRDINPVAVESVKAALGPMDPETLDATYRMLENDPGRKIRDLYRAIDGDGRPCDLLYHFWVMQVPCPHCTDTLDLFSSYVFAQNAYPKRKPEVQVICPRCDDTFEGRHGRTAEVCPHCTYCFDPKVGTTHGQYARCPKCSRSFPVLAALSDRHRRPDFRLYAKLVLREDGRKEYLRATQTDIEAYASASAMLAGEVAAGRIELPSLLLKPGYNTSQAMGYGFCDWRDFFNDRQLLALGWLRGAIAAVPDGNVRAVMLTLFSGLLEFNNMFASYKGEGTGAVRHMFSHHILKPERTPIEANVWGTAKSSGSFSGLYRTRLMRAVAYRNCPAEVMGGNGGRSVVASPAFSGVVSGWPNSSNLAPRGIYLSCGDSSDLALPDRSIDLVVTDPPFFDNVHYSELADFFYAWRQIGSGTPAVSTRRAGEVQDTDPYSFANKLQGVLRECHRVLKDEGLLVFTYHHSREDGWQALARATLGAGFVVVHTHPVKAEMSVATPISAARDPIQFDMVLVCRKVPSQHLPRQKKQAIVAARSQIARLEAVGFVLSVNDRKVIRFGQLLTTIVSPESSIELGADSWSVLEGSGGANSGRIRPALDDASSLARKVLPVEISGSPYLSAENPASQSASRRPLPWRDRHVRTDRGLSRDRFD